MIRRDADGRPTMPHLVSPTSTAATHEPRPEDAATLPLLLLLFLATAHHHPRALSFPKLCTAAHIERHAMLADPPLSSSLSHGLAYREAFPDLLCEFAADLVDSRT